MFVTKARNSPKEIQILKKDKVTGFAPKYLRNHLVFTFAPIRFVPVTRCYLMCVQTQWRALCKGIKGLEA